MNAEPNQIELIRIDGENDQVFDALADIVDAWSFLHTLEEALAYAVGWAMAHGILTEGDR